MLARKTRDYIADSVSRMRISYLRLLGISIGRECFISWRAKLDVRRGNIVMGHRCTITHGCVILSHDRSAKRVNPKDNGEGTVRLGDNVFIGVNSVVLRNVSIGDDSIVGAGSIVTRDVPPNVVVAGNPARIIRELP